MKTPHHTAFCYFDYQNRDRTNRSMNRQRSNEVNCSSVYFVELNVISRLKKGIVLWGTEISHIQKYSTTD